MGELGISPWTSYIFLGLSLSIGLLVYILMRDAARRKKQREEQEQRQAEELLKHFAEQQKRAKEADKPVPGREEPAPQGTEAQEDREST